MDESEQRPSSPPGPESHAPSSLDGFLPAEDAAFSKDEDTEEEGTDAGFSDSSFVNVSAAEREKPKEEIDPKNELALRLLAACQAGSLAEVQALANEYGATCTTLVNDMGWSPLYIASYHGHLPVVEYLTQQKLYEKEEKTHIPLHAACLAGHVHVIAYFLDSNIFDIHGQNSVGWTPLHAACSAGKYDVAKFLVVDRGANVELTDDAGWTAFHVACYNGHLDVVQFLASAKCDANKPSSLGYYPLHAACTKGHFHVVRHLIEQLHVAPDVCDQEGFSAFDAACQGSHTAIAEYLMSCLYDKSCVDTEVEESENASEYSHTSCETPPPRSRAVRQLTSISEYSQEPLSPMLLERECNRLRLSDTVKTQSMEALRLDCLSKDAQIMEMWNSLSARDGELEQVKEEAMRLREALAEAARDYGALMDKNAAQQRVHDRLISQSSALLLAVAIYLPTVLMIIWFTILLDKVLDHHSLPIFAGVAAVLLSIFGMVGLKYSHIIHRFRYYIVMVVGVFLILGVLYSLASINGAVGTFALQVLGVLFVWMGSFMDYDVMQELITHWQLLELPTKEDKGS